MTTFTDTHPEYARIQAHIDRAHAQRALVMGEAIGDGLIAVGHLIERVLHGGRAFFHTTGKVA
jgi:hypothetical protein